MKNKSSWLLPAGLIALGAIPLIAGVRGLAGMAGAIAPMNVHGVEPPVPIIIHIVLSNLFTVLGAFQFMPQFRRRRPGWHREVGKVLMVCGLLSALTGLWMTLFFPPRPGNNEVLYWFRLVFGVGMVVCMVRGYTAIRRRDIAQHRAWITRGYAIGIGAGTQALVFIPWIMLGASTGDMARSLLLGSGWVINLIVAEWIIRYGGQRPAAQRAGSDARPMAK